MLHLTDLMYWLIFLGGLKMVLIEARFRILPILSVTPFRYGFLEIDPQERESGRDPTHLLQAWRSVWARGNYRDRIEIFQWGHESEEISGFTQQACIPMMGNHYWRLTPETECNDELFPWFALYDSDNEIIGTGLQAFGRFPVAEGDWFERPSKEEVQAIVSNGPECIPDLAKNPGLVTIHIYYIDTPWDVVC
ncbi:hypothetical protein NE865_14374 [Phthorimaea operculella]|nr:hypothetical protein NE865_14374 [Phthorimaea operculella]